MAVEDPLQLNPVPAGFGASLALRKRSMLWGFFGWLIVLSSLLGILGILSTLFINSPGQSSRSALGLAQAIAVTSGFLALGWLLIDWGRKSFEYFEKGAVLRRGKRVVLTLRYADVERMTYKTTRQYHNGIYAGTTLSFDLRPAKGKGITYTGRYKEKAKGLGFLGFSKKFEANDELDAVKLIVAQAIANKWALALGSGMPLTWCAGISLSPEGLLCKYGRRKHETIAFSMIDRFAVINGNLRLFHEGDAKHFATVPVNQRNFWPGFVLLSKIWSAKDDSPADANTDNAPENQDEPESQTDDDIVQDEELQRR
jgi:hypothetical protein